MTPKIAWLLVATLAIGGYLRAIAPAHAAIRETQTRAHALYDIAYKNERMIAQAGGLRAARTRVERDLARLAAENGVGKASLALVRVMQQDAAEHAVTLTAFSPEQAGPVSAESSAEAVQIALRGRYAPVLASIAEMSKRGVLVDVAGVDLNGASGDFGDSLIDATIHATLYHGVSAIDAQEGRDNVQTAIR